MQQTYLDGFVPRDALELLGMNAKAFLEYRRLVYVLTAPNASTRGNGEALRAERRARVWTRQRHCREAMTAKEPTRHLLELEEKRRKLAQQS